jgi:hypothetical protein
MGRRAEQSGVTLDGEDVSIIEGMLARGDRQHDIAAWFSVNGGRIAEIATGARFPSVTAAPVADLPPTGSYLSGRDMQQLVQILLVCEK